MSITINEHSYVPAHLAIEAMRDNGYKNTAYAVAELIDNSIQAGASYVQLLCAEKEEQLSTRKTKRLNQIAVLDNGAGMDEKVLRMALQFGNGTRLGRSDRSGIGRFGMGLPASSISQCKRVDVWSWQSGIENALHIYLDVDEVKSGKSDVMPNPTPKSIPERWKQIGCEFEESGTLVVWSKLDRMMWNKGVTLIDNSEQFIGRMYRKFLENNDVKIRSVVFDVQNADLITIDKPALPNDPIYLMDQTSCPEPYHNQSLFNPLGEENYEVKFSVNFQGENHDVIVRLSYAKDEARAKANAGNTPYGKHAAKNVGISIVRAGRELDLDQTLVTAYDPVERWWGIEVEFPPSLDELMGVTNNKQSARNFAEILAIVDKDIEGLVKEGKTINEIKNELEEEGDPRAPLLEVAIFIKNQLKILRDLLKQQTQGNRSKEKAKTRHIETGPEKTATAFTDERKEMGYKGISDQDESQPPEKKHEHIKEELVGFGVDEDTAEQLAATTVSNNFKYLFAETPLESDAFFTVNPCGGAINILLNTRHPAYENLVEVLDDETDQLDAKALSGRLERASEGLKLLLMAWARYEDEIPAEGIRKDFAKDARNDWGRIAKKFLKGI